MSKSVWAKGFMYVAVTLVLLGGMVVFNGAGSSLEAATICKCELPYISNVSGYFTNCFVTNLSSDNVTVKFRLEGTTAGDRSANATAFTGAGTAMTTTSVTALDANVNWNIRFSSYSTAGVPLIYINNLFAASFQTVTGNRYSGALQFQKSNTANSLTCGSHFGSATTEYTSGDIKIMCVQTNSSSADTRRDLPVYCTTLDSSKAF